MDRSRTARPPLVVVALDNEPTPTEEWLFMFRAELERRAGHMYEMAEQLHRQGRLDDADLRTIVGRVLKDVARDIENLSYQRGDSPDSPRVEVHRRRR